MGYWLFASNHCNFMSCESCAQPGAQSRDALKSERTQEARVRKPTVWRPDYFPNCLMHDHLQHQGDSGSGIWCVCDGLCNAIPICIPRKGDLAAKPVRGQPPLAASFPNVSRSECESYGTHKSSPPSDCASTRRQVAGRKDRDRPTLFSWPRKRFDG